jgi:hypothetical protein
MKMILLLGCKEGNYHFFLGQTEKSQLIKNQVASLFHVFLDYPGLAWPSGQHFKPEPRNFGPGCAWPDMHIPDNEGRQTTTSFFFFF